MSDVHSLGSSWYARLSRDRHLKWGGEVLRTEYIGETGIKKHDLSLPIGFDYETGEDALEEAKAQVIDFECRLARWKANR